MKDNNSFELLLNDDDRSELLKTLRVLTNSNRKNIVKNIVEKPVDVEKDDIFSEFLNREVDNPEGL